MNTQVRLIVDPPGLLCMELHKKEKVSRQKINSSAGLKEHFLYVEKVIHPEMLKTLLHNAKDRFDISRHTEGVYVEKFQQSLTYDLENCFVS